MAEPCGVYQFIIDPEAPGPRSGHRPPACSRWIGPPSACPVRCLSHEPFDDLRQLLNASGIWVGYLGYDLCRWVEHLPTPAHHRLGMPGWPVIELAYCPSYLVHDGITGRWTARGDRSGTTIPLSDTPHRAGWDTGGPLRSSFTHEGYMAAVRQAKRYIGAGDIFQVNLAQRLTAEYTAHDTRASRSLYGILNEASPAWFGAYMELGECSGDRLTPTGRTIASCSPELFLEVLGKRVTTRPIKGTRPATLDPQILSASRKDQAELNMIVDLMRNDLGRVCDYGSVNVTEARRIETHPTVHHGVATIAGQLHQSKDTVDLLRAAFPAGSVTGAPKVRAMQIIDELEPAPRGPYCGCLGFLSRHRSCLNVAIRTMLIDQARGRIDFSVGSGIVADSDPAEEYQETLDKAQAMLSTLRLAAAPTP